MSITTAIKEAVGQLGELVARIPSGVRDMMTVHLSAALDGDGFTGEEVDAAVSDAVELAHGYLDQLIALEIWIPFPLGVALEGLSDLLLRWALTDIAEAIVQRIRDAVPTSEAGGMLPFQERLQALVDDYGDTAAEAGSCQPFTGRRRVQRFQALLAVSMDRPRVVPITNDGAAEPQPTDG